jgi:plasmid stabilization system protein ParE
MRRPQQPHEQLEEELRALEKQFVIGTDNPGDGQDEKVKKRVRSIKNCLAAKKSREQARSYVHELETKMSSLEQENLDLARRLALAEAENEAIKRGWKRPSEVVHPYYQDNRDGEPAVLPKSLQLDAVLFTLYMVAYIQGCPELSQASCHTLRHISPSLGGPSTPHPRKAATARCREHYNPRGEGLQWSFRLQSRAMVT